MTFARTAGALFLSLGITACTTTPATFVRVTPAPVTEKVNIAFRSLEIRSVSLPTYAASEEIYGQASDGLLTSTNKQRWADVPERAITLELSRSLAELTGARTAPEPWPFDTRPDAQIDVRFEDLLAGADGIFRATGQYFVSSEIGRERSNVFRLNVAYDINGGAESIAKARSEVVLNLAKLIATKALR